MEQYLPNLVFCTSHDSAVTPLRHVEKYETYSVTNFTENTTFKKFAQDAQLLQRDCAAGCISFG